MVRCGHVGEEQSGCRDIRYGFGHININEMLNRILQLLQRSLHTILKTTREQFGSNIIQKEGQKDVRYSKLRNNAAEADGAGRRCASHMLQRRGRCPFGIYEVDLGREMMVTRVRSAMKKMDGRTYDMGFNKSARIACRFECSENS